MTTDDTAEVECIPLRNALDWLTPLYRPFVSLTVWRFLLRAAQCGGTVRLWRHDRLEATPFKVESDRDADVVFTTKAMASQNEAVIRLQGPGLCAFVKNPEIPANKWPGGHLPYGVEMQMQGTAFSASLASGLEIYGWLKPALEAVLYPEWGHDEASRARALLEHTVVGRWDIACDVMVRASKAGAHDPHEKPPKGTSPTSCLSGPEIAQRWVTQEIFCGGNLDAANDRISSRARKPTGVTVTDEGSVRVRADASEVGNGTRLVGKASTAHSLYRGGKTAELCIYERGRKRDGDWPILEQTLRARGWDGVSPVVRWETRFMREWFRDQQLVVTDRSTDDGPDIETWMRGDEMPLATFIRHLPAFVRCAIGRFQHKVAGPGRVRDRAPSPLYQAVVKSLELFDMNGEGGDGAIARVVSQKREAAKERAMSRALNGVIDVAAHEGVSPEAAAETVLRLIRGEDFEHAAKRYAHTRAVHSYTPRTLEDALQAYDEGGARALALQRASPPPPPSRYAPHPQRTLAGVAS